VVEVRRDKIQRVAIERVHEVDDDEIEPVVVDAVAHDVGASDFGVFRREVRGFVRAQRRGEREREHAAM
jgi:hypothetical protein